MKPGHTEVLGHRGLNHSLLKVEASLARNPLLETPAEAVRPVSARIFARIALAISVASAMPWMFSVTSR